MLRAADPIAIGREPQLFLDDFTVDRLTRVERVLHQPDRKGWILDEAGREFGTGGVYLGNIVYRDGQGIFHMLYRYPWDDPSVAPLHPSIGEDKAHWFRELTGYATSTDGIRWKKPRLGLAEAPASFRKEGPIPWQPRCRRTIPRRAAGFAYDLQAHGNIADPKKKLLFRVTKGRHARFRESDRTATCVCRGLAESSRGSELENQAQHDSGWNTVSPRFSHARGLRRCCQVWFQVCQGRVLDWSKREGREIVRYESPDLVHWTGPEVVLPIQPDELKTPKDYVEYMDLDAYHVGGSRTGAWLGQMVIFHSDRSDQQFRMPRPFVVWRKGTTELRLVMSRDAGRTWQRVGGKQVWLPHGEKSTATIGSSSRRSLSV